MALLNGTEYKTHLAGLQALFMESLESQDQTLVNTLAMRANSTAPSEMYNWCDGLGSMSEWTGDRDLGDIKAEYVTVVNKHYEKSIELSKDDLNDDRLGIAQAKVQGLARLVQVHRTELLADRLNGLFSENGWDGKAICAADHPRDAPLAVQSNLTDEPLDDDAFEAAIEAMMLVTGPAGDLLGIKPTHLIVDPTNKAVAENILKAQFLASGQSNIHYQACDLIIEPRMTTGCWVLVDASRPELKPFVLQVRKEAELVTYEPFLRPNVQAGVDCRDAAAATTYQLFYGSTGDGGQG